MQTLVVYFDKNDFGFFISMEKEAKIWCDFLGYEFVTCRPINDGAKYWTFSVLKEGLPSIQFENTNIALLNRDIYKYAASGELNKLKIITFRRFFEMAKHLNKPANKEVDNVGSMAASQGIFVGSSGAPGKF